VLGAKDLQRCSRDVRGARGHERVEDAALPLQVLARLLPEQVDDPQERAHAPVLIAAVVVAELAPGHLELLEVAPEGAARFEDEVLGERLHGA